jgi:integrase
MSVREPRKVRGIENRRKTRRDGTVYWRFLVRWADPATGARVSEEFDEQRDAIDFQAALRLARRRGGLEALNAGRETLAEYAEAWWESYAARNLSRKTLAAYAVVWNNHALPRIGHLELRAVTPGVIARWRTDLETAGVGAPTIRKTMSVLQAMLRRAVEEDRVKSNAAKEVRKPGVTRKRAVHPLPPTMVERLRDAATNPTDAVLITVLAYAGLRPEEALALEWRHVRKDTLLIEQKNVGGEIVPGQKVDGTPPRTIDLLAAVRSDLAEHRLASGRPRPSALVFPRPDATPWLLSDYENWRRRQFRAAALTAGLANPPIDPKAGWTRSDPYKGARPYDLRHSFASLLIHAGRMSVVEIAAQLGHSTQTLLRTYTHVFAELRGQPKVPADHQIAAARRERARRIG